MTKEIEEFTDRMVRNEVFACVSSIVADLANGYGEVPHGLALADLAEEAAELSYAVEDYEEAATQAGWRNHGHDGDDSQSWRNETDHSGFVYSSAEEVCAEFDLEPYQWEVFEHWIVSGWLGDELKKRGERVGPLGNLTVWGRTTTGQAISMDGVIRRIAADCLADK